MAGEESKSERWVIVDRPITTHDEDRLGTNDVAEQLAAAVRALESRAVIGLLGGFGTGKSSAIALLKDYLDGRYLLIRVSADKHAGLERQRSLIYDIARQYKEQQQVPKEKGEKIDAALEPLEQSAQLKTADVRAGLLSQYLWRYPWVGRILIMIVLLWIALLLIAAVLTIASPQALPNIPIQEIKNWQQRVVAATGFTVAIGVLGWITTKLGADLLRGEATTSHPRAEAADEFERVFLQLIELMSEPGRTQNDAGLAQRRCLVIAIDDIDRLGPDEVLDALATIRTWKDAGPIFIVACDEQIVSQALAYAKGGPSAVGGLGEASPDTPQRASYAAAVHYLNKLFSVRQEITPHIQMEMRRLAVGLLNEGRDQGIHTGWQRLVERSKNDAEDVLTILIHPRVENPRQVKILLNAFFRDYRLACRREAEQRIKPGDVTGNPQLIATLAVLRSEFPDTFRAISREPRLLTALYSAIYGESMEPKDTALISTYFEMVGPARAKNEQGGTPRASAAQRAKTTSSVTRRPSLRTFLSHWLFGDHALQVARPLEAQRSTVPSDASVFTPRPEHAELVAFLLRAIRRIQNWPPSLGPFLALAQSTASQRLGTELEWQVREALTGEHTYALVEVLGKAGWERGLAQAVEVVDSVIDDVPDELVVDALIKVEEAVKGLEELRKSVTRQEKEHPETEFQGILGSNIVTVRPNELDNAVEQLKRVHEITSRTTYVGKYPRSEPTITIEPFRQLNRLRRRR